LHLSPAGQSPRQAGNGPVHGINAVLVVVLLVVVRVVVVCGGRVLVVGGRVVVLTVVEVVGGRVVVVAGSVLVVGGRVVLVGIAQERQSPVADEVHRGLVPGDEQQHAHGQHLALAQLVSLLLGRDEQAQQVFLGALAPLPDKSAKVIAEGSTRRPAPLHDLAIGEQPDGVEAAGDVG